MSRRMGQRGVAWDIQACSLHYPGEAYWCWERSGYENKAGRRSKLLNEMKESYRVSDSKLTTRQVMDESRITTEVPIHTVWRILHKNNLN